MLKRSVAAAPKRDTHSACAVEELESRLLFAVTIATVTISPGASVSFIGPTGTLSNIQFKGCSGTVVFQGDDLEQGSLLNGTPIVKGHISQITEINVTGSSEPGKGKVVMRGSPANYIYLKGFLSNVALEQVQFQPMILQGKLDAPGIAMLNIGSFQNANVQVAGTTGMPETSIVATSATDSIFDIDPGVKSLRFGSFVATVPGNQTMAGSSVFTTATLGSLRIGGDCSSDFNITGSIGSANVGGALNGDWKVGGLTNSFSARSIEASYYGNFGQLNTFNVSGTYSGYITANSIGHASMTNMTNGNLWLTEPFSAGSWSLGTLRANDIENSVIMSYGNLGQISTMFTYSSYVAAGINPSYTFGQPLITSDFLYPSVIKDYYSDCPMKNAMHFDNSYIGAYDLMNVHIGNIQTQNGGIPEGFGATLIGKLKAGIKSGAINLANIHSEADVATALGAAGITSADLGDLEFLLPQ